MAVVLCCASLGHADVDRDSQADSKSGKAVPVYAPDPGDPPAYVPQVHPILLIAGIFGSMAAILYPLSAHVRGKMSRKKLIVCAVGVMLASWAVLLVALSFAPPSEEYQRWQEAHEKWKNKEVVGEIYE